MNTENRYNLPTGTWENFDDDQKELYNTIFEREKNRRETLLQQLAPDCRNTVSQHFDNIVSTIIQDVIQQTNLTMA